MTRWIWEITDLWMNIWKWWIVELQMNYEMWWIINLRMKRWIDELLVYEWISENDEL